MGNYSNYLSKHEIWCKCCHELIFDKKLAQIFDVIRILLNRPLSPSSGYRCPNHNEEVEGKPNSAHLKGLALDIPYRNSGEAFIIMKVLYMYGVTRIGMSDGFIHFDISTDLPQDRLWTY